MLAILLTAVCAAAGLDPSLARGTTAGAPSGLQAEVEGPALISLDLVVEADRSRIVVGLQEIDDAEVRRDAMGRIVLHAPGASLPDALARPLPSGGFDSPVRQVQARRVRGGVEVLVELDETVSWSTEASAGLIWIDLAHPAPRAAPDSPVVDAVDPDARLIPSSPGGPDGVDRGVLIGPGGVVRSSAAAAPPVYTGRRISLDLVDADIHSVLRLIAEVADVNIIASDAVSGTVTVRLVDVPWDQALAAILSAKGLGAQSFGGGSILQISTQSELQTRAAQMSELQAF